MFVTMLETPTDILSHDASADAVRGFIQWRKLLKKPLTERAAVLIAKKLREITAQGGDADEALDMMQEMGWQTVWVDSYWRLKNDNGCNGMGRQRVAIPDTTTRAIANAGSARRTPSKDCF